MLGMSSGVRGLIPKSTGGRMALGAGAALGVAGGIAGFRNRRTQNATAAAMGVANNSLADMRGMAQRPMSSYM